VSPTIFRLELVLLGFFIACWIVFFAVALSGYPLSGAIAMDLYQLYGIAALVGWLSGNIFVQRSQRWERRSRQRVLLIFLLSPGGLYYLLWALGSELDRSGAPFAPLYAFAVSGILFLVPVTLRGSFSGRTRR
jgi:hypothetical protein